MPKHIRSLPRPDMLLRQQRQQEGWEFTPVTRRGYETGAYRDVQDMYEMVYDDDLQGLWYRRRKRASEPAPRRLTNRYDRPTTRLADMLEAIQRIDQATDGEFGEYFLRLFQ